MIQDKGHFLGLQILCLYSRFVYNQRRKRNPEQLRSAHGFGEESKVTRFSFPHLKCHAPMPEADFPYQQF